MTACCPHSSKQTVKMMVHNFGGAQTTPDPNASAEKYRDTNGRRIVIQIGGEKQKKKKLLSAKRRAYFCKSIAIEMGGASRYFSKVSLRAQRLKNFKILKVSSEIDKFKRTAPPDPYFFVGNSVGQNGNFQSRLKISIEIENFKRD